MPFDYEDTKAELAKTIHESAELWRKIMEDMSTFADLQQEIGILTYKYDQQKALEKRYFGQVQESLDKLDGTTESAVTLITGLSSAEIADLGGIETMKREYRASGRYDYWAIDEYWEGDSGTHGDPLIFKTKKQAEEVAARLNAAYAAGIEEAKKDVV